MRVAVKLPKLGETAEQVVVLGWRVAVGDVVKKDQPLVEVDTDKIQTEVVAPVAGTVVGLLAHEDDEVTTGAVLCEIEVGE